MPVSKLSITLLNLYFEQSTNFPTPNFSLIDLFFFLARMSAAALCNFFENEIQDCFDKKLMMSLHMKATMMKV